MLLQATPQTHHIGHRLEKYSDVAYNYAARPHGYLLEGRGIGKSTGANGNHPLNVAHYAIVGLVGSEGLTEPTDETLSAIRDGIELLRQHGAGDEIKGHRDGYSTTCPGGPLYAWVEKGAPRPKGTEPAAPPAAPGPKKYEHFPGDPSFKAGRKSPIVARIHDRLLAVRCKRYASSNGQGHHRLRRQGVARGLAALAGLSLARPPSGLPAPPPGQP
ncbi:N-acetylmuramoyl-L-alanine amidase [Streptomyces sp900116325]|uniref:N-acetylmuramoyl-L-alanine amidase n=1 Tax=Streptomyces sp. 900116325 TaxID=3154295 RepID=UPI003327DEC9